MTLTRALIPAALMLVTGFRAPALADTYTLPAVDVWGDGSLWYFADDAGNDVRHYTGPQWGDWGRFNGVRWSQPAVGAAFNVTDDAGTPIPYTVTVTLAADRQHLLLTIEPDGRVQMPGDWNGDGKKTLDDVFGFVGEWFTTGGTVGEMFEFVEAWLS